MLNEIEDIQIIEGKYRVLQQIGGKSEDGRKLSGAMSTVYKVEDIDTGRVWALKQYLNTGVTKDDRPFRNCLMLEADTLKGLRHRSIPSIIDIIEKEDGFIIVEDYVNGKTLERLLKATANGLPLSDVLGWMIQLCDVLIYLHSQTPPIIYRDLKPENIMLKPNGDIRLVDFGSVCEFSEGGRGKKWVVGTAYYAPPEQIQDPRTFGKGGKVKTNTDNIDQRSDIYALAVTMYRLLTKAKPQDVIADLNSDYRKLESDGITAILKRCVSKDREDRIQTVKELKWALQHYKEFESRYIKKEKTKKYFCFGIGALGVATSVFGAMVKLLCEDLFMGTTTWIIIAAGLFLLIIAGVLFYTFKMRTSIKNAKRVQETLKHKTESEDTDPDDDDLAETNLLSRVGTIDSAYEETLAQMEEDSAAGKLKKPDADVFTIIKSSVQTATEMNERTK